MKKSNDGRNGWIIFFVLFGISIAVSSYTLYITMYGKKLSDVGKEYLTYSVKRTVAEIRIRVLRKSIANSVEHKKMYPLSVESENEWIRKKEKEIEELKEKVRIFHTKMRVLYPSMRAWERDMADKDERDRLIKDIERYLL